MYLYSWYVWDRLLTLICPQVLRLDTSVTGSNHRYLLRGLHVLFTNISSANKDTAEKPDNESTDLRTAIDMVLDAMLYGLQLLDKKPFDHFAAYFPERMEVDEQSTGNAHTVTMKLNNCDGGELECPYFRTDRDDFSLIQHLSKLLIHLAKMLEYHIGWSFNELIQSLKSRHRETSDGKELDEGVVLRWLDSSVQFMAVFNHSHSDLFKRNGDALATMFFNMEKARFFTLFVSHHFYHMANHATEWLGPSNFMTLLFHRHGIYHWFATSRTQLSCSDDRVTASQLEALAADSVTGWRHWMDSQRVQKVWSGLR